MPTLFLISFVLFTLRPQEFIPGMSEAPVMQVVLLISLAVWLGSKDKETLYAPLKLVLAFMVVAAFSVGINGWWGGGIVAIQKLLPSVALFILAASATRSKEQFVRFAWVLVFCCAVLVFHGWQQITTGVGFTGMTLVEGTRIRYLGVFNDPNDLGLIFVLGFVAAGYLMLTEKPRSRRILAAVAIGWISYGVFLTESRGTMLACLSALAYMGIRRFGVGKSVAAFGILVPILWGATRLATISNEEESAQGRIDAWYEGFSMLRSQPIFGVGFGNFTEHNYLTAHNSLVLVMAETGVVGYTLWFAFCGYCLVSVMRLLRSDAPVIDPEQKDATLAVFLSCIGFFVAIMFLSRSYTPLLFIVCGLAVARAVAVHDSLQPAQWPAAIAFRPIIWWAWLSIPIMYLITKLLLTF